MHKQKSDLSPYAPNRNLLYYTTPLLIYVLVFVLIFSDLIAHFSDRLIAYGTSIGSDALGYSWCAYTFKQNWLEHSNLFHTNNILFPDGVSLWMHAYIPAAGFFSLLFSSPVFALNLYFLIHNILSAFGAFLLGIYLKLNWFASLCVGILFSYSAYRLWRITGHYNLTLTATIPFFLIALLKAYPIENTSMEFVKKKWLFIVVLLEIASVFNDYYIAYYQLVLAIAYLLFCVAKRNIHRFSKKKIFLSLLIFIIASHFIARLFDILNFDSKAGLWWGGDFINFINPTTNSLLYSSSFFKNIFSDWSKYTSLTESNIFMGFTFIFLFIWLLIAFISKKTHSNIEFYLFFTLIVLLFMFPTFKVAGKSMLNMPTAFFHYIPFINNFRCNTRMGSFLPLFISIAFFLYVQHAFPSKANFIIAVVTILLFVENYPTYHMFSIKNDVSPVYTTIRHSEGKVMTLMPNGLGDGLEMIGTFRNQEHFNQVIHQKKLTGGLVSRLDPKVKNAFLGNKVMADILLLSNHKDSVIAFPNSADKAVFFNYFKTDLFLIHPDYRGSYAEQYLLDLAADTKYKIIDQDSFRLIMRNQR